MSIRTIGHLLALLAARHRVVAIAAAAVLIGAFGAGCVVSESTYESKIEELDNCVSERDDLALQRNALRDKGTKREEQMRSEMDASRQELDALRQQREELDKQIAEYQKLTARFQELVDSDGLKIDVRRGRMLVSLPSSVLFPSGKADISKRGAATLARVAGKLKDFAGRRIIVAGHTDNVRIGDSDKIEFTDNWELSTARALRVTRFLIEQGLDPKQLAAAGYGPHDPLRSNRNKRGRKLNRRIELILEPKLPDFRKLARLSRQAEQAARAAGKPDGGEDSADSDPNGGTEGAGKDDDSKK